MPDNTRITPTNPNRYGPGPVLESLGVEARGLLVEVARSAVFGQTGSDFFSSIAHFLYAVVGAELVLVGRIAADDPDFVETMACYRAGECAPNIRYALAGTPCSTVINPPRLCAYPAHIADIFPDDAELTSMGAQGYLGLPLFARGGRQIGLLSLVTTRPIEDPDTLSGLLLLVGTRASLELEYHLMASHADADARVIAQLLLTEDERIRSAIR